MSAESLHVLCLKGGRRAGAKAITFVVAKQIISSPILIISIDNNNIVIIINIIYFSYSIIVILLYCQFICFIYMS